MASKLEILRVPPAASELPELGPTKEGGAGEGERKGGWCTCCCRGGVWLGEDMLRAGGRGHKLLSMEEGKLEERGRRQHRRGEEVGAEEGRGEEVGAEEEEEGGGREGRTRRRRRRRRREGDEEEEVGNEGERGVEEREEQRGRGKVRWWGHRTEGRESTLLQEGKL